MTTGNRLTDMEFDEISLVTRPANQLSKVVLFKSDTAVEEPMTSEVETETTEDEMSKGGYGKMKGMKKKGMKVVMEDDMSEDEMMDDEEEMTSKGGMKRRVKKEEEMDEETLDLPEEVYEYVQALEAANAELLEQIEKMAAETNEIDNEESEDIMKSADPRLVEILKSAQERAEAAEMIAKAERDFRLEREFVSKCATLTHLPIDNDDFGKVLKSIADVIDTDTFNKVWQVLEAANANIGTGNTFKEIGKSTGFHNDGPATNIEKAAAKIQSENPNLSREQAIAKAVENDPTLYISYLREGN